MSELNKIIMELCPEGVPYMKLEKCCILQKGSTAIQKATPGEYPLVVTTAERKSSADYQFDQPTVCIPLVSSRGHGVACLNQVFYQEGKFALGNILCGVTPKNGLLARFLYFYLNHKKDSLIVPLMKGGANVSLTVNSLKTIKVPVPPVKVQEEIIRILETTNELIGCLEKDLEYRRLQYDTYSELLFNQLGRITGNQRLGDVIESLKTGLNPRKNFKLNSGGAIPYITGKDVFSNSINVTDKTDYIDEKALGLINKRAELQSGTVLFASTGTGTVGRMAVVEEYNDDWGISETLYVLKPIVQKVLPKYIMYALYSPAAKKQFEPKISKGSVPHLKVADLLNVMIPVPDITEQNRIISLLDQFDRLCNDAELGIPKEIELRKSQMEYLKNKILCFEENRDEQNKNILN